MGQVAQDRLVNGLPVQDQTDNAEQNHHQVDEDLVPVVHQIRGDARLPTVAEQRGPYLHLLHNLVVYVELPNHRMSQILEVHQRTQHNILRLYLQHVQSPQITLYLTQIRKVKRPQHRLAQLHRELDLVELTHLNIVLIRRNRNF